MNKILAIFLAVAFIGSALAVPLPPKRPADLNNAKSGKTWPPGYTGKWLPPKEIQDKLAKEKLTN